MRPPLPTPPPATTGVLGPLPELQGAHPAQAQRTVLELPWRGEVGAGGRLGGRPHSAPPPPPAWHCQGH